jgi:hypothetical protein
LCIRLLFRNRLKVELAYRLSPTVARHLEALDSTVLVYYQGKTVLADFPAEFILTQTTSGQVTSIPHGQTITIAQPPTAIVKAFPIPERDYPTYKHVVGSRLPDYVIVYGLGDNSSSCIDANFVFNGRGRVLDQRALCQSDFGHDHIFGHSGR